MKVINYNRHKITLYDSITELPIWRFQLYTKYLILASGIGSSLADIDNKFSDLRVLMKDSPNDALRLTVNLQQALHFAIQNVSPQMMAFVVLIHKIDGREVVDDDLTEDGIKRIIKELSVKRFSFQALQDALSGFKKKIETEFSNYFPGLMDNSRMKEFYARLRQRTLLVLRSVQEAKEEYAQQIKQIDKAFLQSNKPRIFHGSSGMEVQMAKEFESTLVLLSQHGAVSSPRNMTTLAYYQALEVIKQQNKISADG